MLAAPAQAYEKPHRIWKRVGYRLVSFRWFEFLRFLIWAGVSLNSFDQLLYFINASVDYCSPIKRETILQIFLVLRSSQGSFVSRRNEASKVKVFGFYIFMMQTLNYRSIVNSKSSRWRRNTYNKADSSLSSNMDFYNDESIWFHVKQNAEKNCISCRFYWRRNTMRRKALLPGSKQTLWAWHINIVEHQLNNPICCYIYTFRKLQIVKRNNDLVVIPPDKGSGIIRLNHTDHIDKGKCTQARADLKKRLFMG